MAFGVDATGHLTGHHSDAGTTRTWNHTVGASANKVVTLITLASNTAGDKVVGSLTYNSVDLVSSVAKYDAASWASISIGYQDSPSTGTHAFVVGTSSNNFDDSAAYSISFNDSAAGVVARSSGAGTTANPQVTATGIQSGDIVIAALASDNAASTTSADTVGGATLVFKDEDVNSDTEFACEYYTATGTSQVVKFNTSDSGGSWVIAWVAIRAASAAGVAISAAAMPAGLNAMGTGLTRAVLPGGLGNMG